MSDHPFTNRLALIMSSSWPQNLGVSVRLLSYFGAEERIVFWGTEWLNTTGRDVWGVQSMTSVMVVAGSRFSFISNIALIPADNLMLLDGEGSKFLRDMDREFCNESKVYPFLLPWNRPGDGGRRE